MLHYRELTGSIDLAWSDRPVPWKCNGLVIRGEGGTVLIDCNFAEDEIAGLVERTAGHIDAYFVTHMHIDHVNNLHFWEKHDIPIHCPVPEDGYLRNFQNLLDASGSTAYGTNDIMQEFTRNIQGFREITRPLGFAPGIHFGFGSVTVDTLPLPGHSPGHTGFIISDAKDPREQRVLFASDIGLDDFGAWYGFAYCDLGEYRRSITLLKKLCAEGDFILAGSHGASVFGNRETAALDAITEKMDRAEERLLRAIADAGPVALRDLTLKGIYYNLSSIGKMNEFIRRLYRFWEYHALNNHARELAGRDLVNMRDDGTVEAAREGERALA